MRHIIAAGVLCNQPQCPSGHTSDPVLSIEILIAYHIIPDIERQYPFCQLRLQQTAIGSIGDNELVLIQHPTLDMVERLGKELVSDPRLAQPPIADQRKKASDVISLASRKSLLKLEQTVEYIILSNQREIYRIEGHALVGPQLDCFHRLSTPYLLGCRQPERLFVPTRAIVPGLATRVQQIFHLLLAFDIPIVETNRLVTRRPNQQRIKRIELLCVFRAL